MRLAAIFAATVFAISSCISLANELPGDLNSIQSLTVEQAEELVRRKSAGDVLQLNQLTSLTAEVAEALARHPGCIELNGLQSMTLDAEIALAKQRTRSGSARLECRGLTTLASKELAEALRAAGNFNYANQLIHISPEAARVLVGADLRYPPTSLSLDHLEELTPEVAAALSEFRGRLSLRGLSTLSADAAVELMRFQEIPGQDSYHTLRLDGLTQLSPDVAAEIGEYPGYLSLDGLASLSDQAAEALARHKGGMSLGLTTLSDYAAETRVSATFFL